MRRKGCLSDWETMKVVAGSSFMRSPAPPWQRWWPYAPSSEWQSFLGGWGILVGGISGVIGNVEVDLAPPARRWRALATVNGGDENRWVWVIGWKGRWEVCGSWCGREKRREECEEVKRVRAKRTYRHISHSTHSENIILFDLVFLLPSF
jgi:hypothetical protein